ncbi:AraC family transcriptional regulator [Pedobacter frigoris]|uniref:AraC family transcriptional regulator n=1 Tax=Pedobacter frigoris TaxID=2571272 RepID=A0A4U1CSC9_9SPHI|nr:AraC family transcriptional regulator [Pedobacter frigoris]TKC08829.1 AraC family transcriptional regulator [Pedobacter frigoris]
MPELDLQSTKQRTIIDFRKWKLNTVIVLGYYRYKTVFPELKPHKHSGMIEICFCLKGEQTYEVNGELYQIKGGDILITYPDEIHSSAGHPEDKGELYWLILDFSQHNKFPAILNFNAEESKAYFQCLFELPKRHFEGTSGMKKQLDLVMELKNNDTLSTMQVIQVKHALSGFLIELVQVGNNLKVTKSDESLNRIKKYVADHIQENFSIEQLAGLIFLSESRFKSWFKQKTGLPPLEYVLRKKIQYSKLMLENNDNSINNIAHELGFSSSQYFSNVFKKFTGFKPTDYRNSIRSAVR